MLRTTTPRLTWLAMLAAATLFTSANANADEVRVGRYATVALNPPLTESKTTPRRGAVALPNEVASRADAVHWILEQHDYQLHEGSRQALDLASILAAPLSIRSQEHLPGTLRLALQAVLGPRIAVLIDLGTRQVVLSMLETHADGKAEKGNEQ